MKTAVVTGASSGIGRAIAKALAKLNYNLILLARRTELLESLKEELESLEHYAGKVAVFRADVRDEKRVSEIFVELPVELENISVLINNAGLAKGLDSIQSGNLDDWNQMIDTNIKGLLHSSKAVIPHLIKNGGGDIINIGSIAGHEVYPKGNVYCATKHAVAAITQGMRMDLLGTGIKVSTVDPGLVETEFSTVRFNDPQRAKSVYQGVKPLSAEDIADAISWILQRPKHVQIAEMVILADRQASATIVHREA